MDLFVCFLSGDTRVLPTKTITKEHSEAHTQLEDILKGSIHMEFPGLISVLASAHKRQGPATTYLLTTIRIGRKRMDGIVLYIKKQRKW